MTRRVRRDPRRHVSYLLRLWQAQTEGVVVWRASLQSPDTDKRQGFATVVDLLSFLEEEYGPTGHPKKDSHVNMG